jgi:tRNA nucleotidyltransferase/poly(A) polymerase
VKDLAAKRLDTPLDPEIAFSDDPLRMLRAARFAAQLELVPAPRVLRAIEQMHDRLEIVSAERINEELTKLLLAEAPSRGLELVVATGLAREFLPELAALQLEQDPVHKHKDVLHHTFAVVEKTEATGDPTLRLAALLHDVGKPRPARSRPRASPSTITRSSGRAWRANASRRCGTRHTWWTTSPVSSRCTCDSTATPSGATARSAGTCVTPGRCSTS